MKTETSTAQLCYLTLCHCHTLQNNAHAGSHKQPPKVFYKKGFLKNFAKIAGKRLCQSLFFNKVAGLRHRCFPVNFAKFLRTHFLQNTSGWLLFGSVTFSDIVDFEIKEFCIDVFYYFDKSTKRNYVLQEYSSFCDQDCRDILKHGPWLSLERAIDRRPYTESI